jgi:2-phosphosulfolactate phosphatase
MKCHVIEGVEGCAFAKNNGYVAIIVDALRASATATMLLDAGAEQLFVAREVDEAFALKISMPEALLYGERGGLPPEGFDFGNSPRTVSASHGKNVIFTTTTGALRLVDSWGARAVMMGTTLNARVVAEKALSFGVDIVVIPAGLATDPNFNAQEDWVASAAIASMLDLDFGFGANSCHHWQTRIRNEGIPALFASAPHSAKLRAVNLEEDITYCAQMDISKAIPIACERLENCVLVKNASTL